MLRPRNNVRCLLLGAAAAAGDDNSHLAVDDNSYLAVDDHNLAVADSKSNRHDDTAETPPRHSTC